MDPPLKELEGHLKDLSLTPMKGFDDPTYFRSESDFAVHPDKQLCRSCGWSTHKETKSSYISRLKILKTRDAGGMWRIGEHYMLQDRPRKWNGNDFITHKFLKEQGVKHIPLLEEMKLLSKEDDDFQLTLMSRAKGMTLAQAWPRDAFPLLTVPEMRHIKRQMVAAIRELRTFTKDSPQTVDGKPLYDAFLGHCGGEYRCKFVGRTNEEWLSSLAPELREGIRLEHPDKDAQWIEAELKRMVDAFPKSEPYVLTHADLNATNIMVKDGKIEAIIDWEYAGYLPWWMARFLAWRHGQLPHTLDRLIWKELDPDMSDEEFYEKVIKPVDEICWTYSCCHTDSITHLSACHEWVREPWCECHPVGGRICRDAFGWNEHDEPHLISEETKKIFKGNLFSKGINEAVKEAKKALNENEKN